MSVPALAALPTSVTLRAGAPLQIPLHGTDDDGDPLVFAISTSNKSVDFAFSPSTDRSLKISVSHASSGANDPAFSGDMILKLFEDKAPAATARIIQLANSGFYNSTVFHRIINGFVIQGGDPLGNGTGGSGVTFDDDFTSNYQFTGSGQLAMAKSYDDTNDSQFFITEGTQRHLDFNHTIFGQLVEGESIRDKISNVPTDASGKPLSPVTMTSVTVIPDKQNGVLTLSVPAAVTSGSVNVSVVARDPSGTDSAPRSFTVTVLPDDADPRANSTPYLTSFPTQINTRANTPVDFQLAAKDVEGDPPVYLDYYSIYANFVYPDRPYKNGEIARALAPDPNGSIDFVVDPATGAGTITLSNNVAGVFPIYVGVAQDLDALDTQIIPLMVSPAAPTVDLVDASDTGVSSSDNLTKFNNADASSRLTFQVSNVLPGAVVTLMDGTTQIGQASVAAGATSVTITTSGTSTWQNRTHDITAVQALNNYAYHIGNQSGTVTLTSLASSVLSIIVDAVPPSASAPFFSYLGTTQTLAYLFSEDVSASLTPADFVLLNRQSNTTVPANLMQLSYAGNVAALRFPGYANGALPDGDYRATIVAGGITDAAGNALLPGTAFDFYFMAGDVNHDRKVDFNDLVVLAQNYNTTGKTYAQGDLNYDTRVDFNDLVILAQRYNTSLPAPAAPVFAAEDASTSNVEKPLFSVTPVAKPTPAPAKPKPAGKPMRR